MDRSETKRPRGRGAPHKAGKARGSKAQRGRGGRKQAKTGRPGTGGAKQKEEPRRPKVGKFIAVVGHCIHCLSCAPLPGRSSRGRRALQRFAAAMLQPPVVDRKLTGQDHTVHGREAKAAFRTLTFSEAADWGLSAVIIFVPVFICPAVQQSYCSPHS